DFSQISITRDKRLIGSLNEMHLYQELVRDPRGKSHPVESIMQPAFPFVDISTPVELLSTMITPENPAVLVRDFKTEKTFIITRSDIIRVLIADACRCDVPLRLSAQCGADLYGPRGGRLQAALRLYVVAGWCW